MSTADDLRDMSAHLRAHPEANLRDEFDTLLWLLIEAFSKPGDDLAEAGRNDTAVVRDGDDGAGKGATARSLPPLAGAGVQSGCESVRDASKPHRGAQSLAASIREDANYLLRIFEGSSKDVREAAETGSVLLEQAADRADDLTDDVERVTNLTTERDRLAAWKREAMVVLTAYDDLAKRVVPEPTLGRSWVDMLAEHVDAVTAERDEARAEVESLQRAAQVTDASWREHVKRAKTAERERDEAREMVERMKTATTPLRIEREEPEDDQRVQAWYAIWNHPAIAGHWTDEETAIEIVFRRLADLTQAEAAVARVRALVDRPLIPSALLLEALCGADAGGEA